LAASEISSNATSEINNNTAAEISCNMASEINKNAASEINSNAASSWHLDLDMGIYEVRFPRSAVMQLPGSAIMRDQISIRHLVRPPLRHTTEERLEAGPHLPELTKGQRFDAPYLRKPLLFDSTAASVQHTRLRSQGGSARISAPSCCSRHASTSVVRAPLP
jgi:hypothetical protein